VERPRRDREPARRFPPQIEGQRLDRLGIRQIVHGLQHDHRGDHLGRDRGPTTRLEQISEHLLAEQLVAMPGQEREHPTRRQQMPGYRLDIQDLALRINPSLHPPILPAPDTPTRTDTTRFSGAS